MKKGLFLLLTVLLAACSNNDDMVEEPVKASLVGTWRSHTLNIKEYINEELDSEENATYNESNYLEYTFLGNLEYTNKIVFTRPDQTGEMITRIIENDGVYRIENGLLYLKDNALNEYFKGAEAEITETHLTITATTTEEVDGNAVKKVVIRTFIKTSEAEKQ